jgi:hypothetical protein
MDILENKSIKITHTTLNKNIKAVRSRALNLTSGPKEGGARARKYHTNNFIIPLLGSKHFKLELISAMDIETIDYKGIQVPICISMAYTVSIEYKFNNIDLFNDIELLEEFKQYSLQDSISLLDALNYAQLTYYDSYKVDITSILSTSTLSLKIFSAEQTFFNY